MLTGLRAPELRRYRQNPAMAKLSDVPPVIRSMGAFPFLKRIAAEIGEDEVSTWASALAYSWVFAMFPLLLSIVTLAPYLPGSTKDDAVAQMSEAFERAGVRGDAATSIKQSFKDVLEKPQGGLLSLGLALAIFGASGGMAVTMSALDKVYEVKVPRPFWKQRLVAIGLTVATIVLVLLVLVLLPIGGKLLDHFKASGSIQTAGAIAINVVRYALAIGLLLGVLSLVYYFGPNTRLRWQAVSPGALLAVAVWIVLGFGFGIYLEHFANFNATYGTLGAAIALLLFFFLSANVLLVGAEINSVVDFAVLGVEPGTQDVAQAVGDAKQDGRLTPQGRPTGSPPQQARAAAAAGKQPMAETINPPASAAEAAQSAKPGGRKGPQLVTGGRRPVPRPAEVPPMAAAAGWWKWGLVALVVGKLVDKRASAATKP